MRSTCEAYLRRKGKKERAVREDRKKSQGDRAKKRTTEEDGGLRASVEAALELGGGCGQTGNAQGTASAQAGAVRRLRPQTEMRSLKCALEPGMAVHPGLCMLKAAAVRLLL